MLPDCVDAKAGVSAIACVQADASVFCLFQLYVQILAGRRSTGVAPVCPGSGYFLEQACCPESGDVVVNFFFVPDCLIRLPADEFFQIVTFNSSVAGKHGATYESRFSRIHVNYGVKRMLFPVEVEIRLAYFCIGVAVVMQCLRYFVHAFEHGICRDRTALCDSRQGIFGEKFF